MDFALSQSQALIQKEVSGLARAFGSEYWRDKDRRAEYPTEFVEAFARAGWLGIVIPEAYGGAGLGVTEAALMLEAICASGAALSGASPIHSNAAKVLAAEAGFEACDAALQTFGGFGYAKEFDVERLWREVRLYKIAPVSQQMALNYLAERVLGLPKSY